MRKTFLSVAAFVAILAGSADAADNAFIGVVNFANCVTESKAGKKEQENMENLRKQMSSLIENTEKELREITAKFDDTEYLDSLSPKAEEELKIKHQSLQEDLGRYQQQFYQVLNHANYQMVQKMSTAIAAASEKIAKSRNFDYVINREACFYIRSDLDVTDLVVSEMDRSFDLDSKKTREFSESGEELQNHAVDDMTLQQAG